MKSELLYHREGVPGEARRVRIFLRGQLQGMGFRPFIYNLAQGMGLKGWVRNSPQGVLLEAEGDFLHLQNFIRHIRKEAPPQAQIQEMETRFLDSLGYDAFTIAPSEEQEGANLFIMPDTATCSDCLDEIFDSNNRRYLYPFTHCIQCGPRFSIIESLPYDRERTAMKSFTMCEPCKEEYQNPEDRRFHSQSNSCAECGPQLELWGAKGNILSARHNALKGAVKAIREGAVVALKSLGGFQLMVDAGNEKAVASLRLRKNRAEKPFALMFPSLERVREDCHVSMMEAELLLSPKSPIVLLDKKNRERNRPECISNPLLGVMLPFTPLHHIFMKELGTPVVATSGNLADETLCTDEGEVLARLGGVADYFFVHNRPIVRFVDDSIARILMGREQVLRRARGYATWSITLKDSLSSSIAVGGNLKNTVAMSEGEDVFISQHIGDLQNSRTYSAFETTLTSFNPGLGKNSAAVSCDFHPDYLPTQWAEENYNNCVPVQHHVAHILSCMAENEIEGPVLGVAWDGSGYGLDGTVWGGEFFHITAESFNRVACFRPFPLPGGEKAVREPRRSSLGVLYEMMGQKVFQRPELVAAFSDKELSMFRSMLVNGINCPRTSSCGRLFDAVAGILGVRQVCSYEGQSAMELEFSAGEGSDHYPVNLNTNPQRVSKGTHFVPPYYNLSMSFVLDWEPMINALLHDRLADEIPLDEMSLKFHNSLAESIVLIAEKIGEEKIVLSGGCFQNRLLTEKSVQRLRQAGFKPYWHQKVPTNDGGLALGQIRALQWIKERERMSCA